MNKTNNITPKNDKNQPHGFWEMYWNDGTLRVKNYHQNGELIGYYEDYNFYDDCELYNKIFYLR